MLCQHIRRRQVDDYIIQLRIATNPHLEPKEARTFVERLMAARGGGGSPQPPERPFDRKKFEELRKNLGRMQGGRPTRV